MDNLYITGTALGPLRGGITGWEKDLGWEIVPIPRGYYAVTVDGFRKIKGREIIRFGFEFVLSPCNTLPELTANLSMSIQILTL